jgi:proline iminopeptidase
MKAMIRNSEIYFDVAGMQLAPTGDKFVERPVLFLLHGGPGGSHLRFKQNSLELQEIAQLVFIDHRGCGRSKKTKSSEYTLENNVADVEALRQYLGLKKICILGTSYGGMVAQAYAIRYPKNIEKLILVATAPSYRHVEEAKKNLQKNGNAKQIAICEYLWNGNFRNSAHAEEFFDVMDSLYSVTARSKKKRVYAKSNIKFSHEALNKGFGDFLRDFDFIPQLNRIICPTLILAGQEDWICSPDQSRLLAKKIKNSQLKIFRKCGHAVATDVHDKYIRIIKKFFSQKISI